jgi:hypothetical protein
MNIDLNNNNGSSEFLNFSEALNHLRWGERIARRTWREGKYIFMEYRNDHAPAVRIKTGYTTTHSTWAPCQETILAEDWYVLGDHQ